MKRSLDPDEQASAVFVAEFPSMKQCSLSIARKSHVNTTLFLFILTLQFLPCFPLWLTSRNRGEQFRSSATAQPAGSGIRNGVTFTNAFLSHAVNEKSEKRI